MSDYSELVKRLREHAENMYVDFLNEAAEALEAQAKEIAELEAELVAERIKSVRLARELDATTWKHEATVKWSTKLRKALKKTLAIAERNELGDYQLRARAALKGEK